MLEMLIPTQTPLIVPGLTCAGMATFGLGLMILIGKRLKAMAPMTIEEVNASNLMSLHRDLAEAYSDQRALRLMLIDAEAHDDASEAREYAHALAELCSKVADLEQRLDWATAVFVGEVPA